MSRTRTLITKGVYKDKFGVAVIVSVQGKPLEFRWELDEHGRKLRKYDPRKGASWYRAERKRVQARERLTVERRAAKGETFAADVERFLQTLSGGHKVNTAGYLSHWIKAFGDAPRNTLTELDVQTAYASIRKGASTKRHIRRALVSLYTTLNGVSGYNPARVLIPPPKPQEGARAIPYDSIENIFAALQPSRARARLKILAYVGLPQKQIAQLQPADLRLEAREIIVRPRRKGAGVEGRALPLSDKGVEALQEFADLQAFGTFQNSQLVRTFKLGAKLAKVTLADDARPYDLRHSFLTEIYRSTGDPYALSALGMHATLEQGARYVKGALSERATKAIGSVPRFGVVAAFPTDTKRSTLVARRKVKTAPKRPKPAGKKSRNPRGKL